MRNEILTPRDLFDNVDYYRNMRMSFDRNGGGGGFPPNRRPVRWEARAWRKNPDRQRADGARVGHDQGSGRRGRTGHVREDALEFGLAGVVRTAGRRTTVASRSPNGTHESI